MRTLATVWLFSKLLVSYSVYGLFVRPRIANEKDRLRRITALHEKNARRLFDAFSKLGGIYIKIGQFLSTQMVVLPGPYLKEMAKMQDRVPKTDFSIINAHLHRLYPDYDQHFDRIDPEPLASASIGQVHHVKFRDGRDGVIKVKYPGLDPWFLHDLAVIEALVPVFVRIIERIYYREQTAIDHRKTLGEFARYMRFELDYENERRNQEKFWKMFHNYRGVIVPEIYGEHCNQGVIAMQYVEGQSVLRYFLSDISQEQKDKTYEVLIESGIYGLLHFGTFQADPHPGNFMVTGNHEVVMLDFGCVKTLPGEFHKGIGEFVGGFLNKDTRRVAETLWSLGFRTKQRSVESLEVWVRFAFDRIAELFQHIEAGTNFVDHFRKKLGSMGMEVYQLDKDHRVDEIPEEYIMLGRALSTPPLPYNKYQPKLNIVAVAMRNLPPMKPAAVQD